MSDSKVVAIEHVQFSHAPWTWNFAEQRRADINAHFTMCRDKTPDLWNGRVLLVNDVALDGAALRGNFFETDFASFIAWRDWGFPDVGVTNLFAMGAIRSADGAYLLGVMGAHTVNPGRVYFPAGTPDPDDISGNSVDLAGSVLREVEEETGLTAADFIVSPDWTAVFVGRRIALMRSLQARAEAAPLREKILSYLSHQSQPELTDIRIVRDRRDFDPNMPEFMFAFLAQALSE